ncbi:MAG: hypothetical protein AVDCRST_MAG08-646, partial [uncultured Acetobacteraceae bacterium]
ERSGRGGAGTGAGRRQAAARPVRDRHRGRRALGPRFGERGAVPAGHGAARAARRGGRGRDLRRRRVLAAGAAGALPAAAHGLGHRHGLPRPALRGRRHRRPRAGPALHGGAAAAEGGDARGLGKPRGAAERLFQRAGGGGAGPLRPLAPSGAGPLPGGRRRGPAGAARPRRPDRQVPGRGERQPAGADARADRVRAGRAGLLRARPVRAGAAEPPQRRALGAAGPRPEEPQLLPGFPEGARRRVGGALPDAGRACFRRWRGRPL